MRIPRRSLLLLAGVGACAPADDVPAPPPLPDAELVEPAVVSALERSRARVVAAPRDAEAWRTLAARLDANGLPDAAAEAWEATVRLAPDDPRPRLHLARMLHALGRDDEALAALRAAEERAPDVAALRVRRGAWLLDAGRIDAAAAAFDEAARLAPDAEGPRIGRARVALERGEADAARRALEALVAGGSREPYVFFLLARVATLQGDEVAAAVARARSRTDRRSDWLVCDWEREVLEERAGFDHRKDRLLARMRREPPGTLLDDLAALHAERPDDLGLLAARVEALVASGDAGGAGALLDEAAAARPDHPRVALLRSKLRRVSGDLPGAVEAAARAVRLQPELGVAHLQLGLLTAETGDRAEAVAALEEALRLGVEDGALFMNLALLQHELGRAEDAVRTLEASLERVPEFLPACLLLAELRLRAGDPDAARRAVLHAERIDPDDRRVRDLAARLGEGDGR